MTATRRSVKARGPTKSGPRIAQADADIFLSSIHVL